MNTRATASGASAATAVEIAGRADSSPAMRCQSASARGVYAPPGPRSVTVAPGWTDAAHGPATPSSPWTTKSIAISRATGSTDRTV